MIEDHGFTYEFILNHGLKYVSYFKKCLSLKYMAPFGS